MTYTPEQYARAYIGALEYIDADTAARRLAEYIRQNGDMHSSGAVVEAVCTEDTRQNGGRRVRFEFARQPREQTVAQLTDALAREHDDVSVVIEPRHIAGVRVVVDEEHELDATFARRLKTVFS